jgi:hypothetical protein
MRDIPIPVPSASEKHPAYPDLLKKDTTAQEMLKGASSFLSLLAYPTIAYSTMYSILPYPHSPSSSTPESDKTGEYT